MVRIFARSQKYRDNWNKVFGPKPETCYQCGVGTWVEDECLCPECTDIIEQETRRLTGPAGACVTDMQED